MSMVHSDGKYIPFVVLFEGRSGSTYLIEALDSHPQIHAEKECLATLRRRVKEGKAEPEEQLKWVREFLGSSPPVGCFAVGFKTKYRDVLDPEGLARLLEKLQVKVLLLQRRNRIKLVVSLMNAIRLNDTTGDWNLYRATDRLPAMTIDVDEFSDYLKKVEERNRLLVNYAHTLNLPTLSLYYENLLVNNRVTLQQVCTFLGVQFKTLRPGTMKNTSDNLREVIVNFDELRYHYVGASYEKMFDEVLITTRYNDNKIGKPIK
jgi:LPS sulfotransferase NodH